MTSALGDLGRAFAVLTALPLGGRLRWREEQLPRCVVFFPLVGAALGAALWGLDWALAFRYGLPVRAALLLVAAALVTGGLHLDGLADTCDGLFGTRERERAFEAMRDPRLGAFGAAGLALTLLLKFAVLAWLGGPLRRPAVFLAPVAGRQAMVLAMAHFPAARPGRGLAGAFARRIGPGSVAGSLGFTLLALLMAVGGAGPAPGAPAALSLAFGGATLVAFYVATRAARRLGGLTGDVYGAVNELAEVSFLLLAGGLAGPRA